MVRSEVIGNENLKFFDEFLLQENLVSNVEVNEYFPHIKQKEGMAMEFPLSLFLIILFHAVLCYKIAPNDHLVAINDFIIGKRESLNLFKLL